MKRIAWLFALLATAAVAERPTDFAYGIPLAVEGDHAFYRLDLPAAVYAGSARTDWGDIRIFNADDAMVPYAYIPPAVPAREKRPAIALPIFPLFADPDHADPAGLSLDIMRNAGGTIVSVTTRDASPAASERRLIGYLVDATSLGDPLSALTLVWPQHLQGMTIRVRLEASDDLDRWRTLAAEAPVLDLEYAGRRLTHDRIQLPSVRTRYLRLSWPGAASPLVLSGVQGHLEERVVEPDRQWSETTAAAVSGNDNEYEFEFEFSEAYPVDRVAIVLPEINAVVPGELLARSTRDQPWRRVTSLISYRLRQGGVELTADPIPVSAPAMRYWLLRVDPKSGGLGHGLPRLRVGWLPQQIVFAARGAGPFVLTYGNPNLASNALPITTLVPGYLTAKDPLAAAGTARGGASGPLGGTSRLRPAFDLRRGALWAVLLLGVAVLAWMAWRLSRQLQTPPAAQGPSQGDSKPS